MTPKTQDAPPLAPLPIDEAAATPKVTKPVKQPTAAPTTPPVPVVSKEKSRGRLIRSILSIACVGLALGLAIYSLVHRLREETTRRPTPKGKRPAA